MNYLYALLNIAAVAGPIILSFDKRVRYVWHWKSVFLASVLVAFPFIIHDNYFTKTGIWGFNDDYLIGLNLLHLPIEEWAFFIIVPFCCYFIYRCCDYYLKKPATKIYNRIIQLLIFGYTLYILLNSSAGIYSYWVGFVSLLVLIIWIFHTAYDHQGIAFVISLVPFLLMNGALTGSFTSAPVVWYNESAKITGRIGTIPFEDVLYAFSLIISVNLLATLLKKKFT